MDFLQDITVSMVTIVLFFAGCDLGVQLVREARGS